MPIDSTHLSQRPNNVKFLLFLLKNQTKITLLPIYLPILFLYYFRLSHLITIDLEKPDCPDL